MVLRDPFEKQNGFEKNNPSNEQGAALPVDRLASHVADLVLLVPIMALAMAPFRRAIMEAKLLDNALDSDWALIQGFISAIAVGIVWDTFFVSMWGTSPGRAIFGLRVVDVWTGEKPRPFNAFLRALMWWGSVLALGAPFFGVYGNLRRRPLHDRIGDTEVRSRNTRRQSAPPRMTELAAGSLFTTGAIFFAVLVFFSQMMVFNEHARVAKSKDEPHLCEEVSSAVENWEAQSAKPTRISVALSLSSAGVIESDCLEREADYALWNDQGRLLGYLAKGLLRFGRDYEESDQYFAKVCDLEPDSDSCRVVGWYRELAMQSENSAAGNDSNSSVSALDRSIETVESLEKLARSILPNGARKSQASNAPDWMRLLLLRELFVQKGDPGLILQLTQEPAHHESVGAKLVEYRARALWRLDRKREAKATVFSTVDALPRHQRVVLTSWLCSRELYESSCTQDSNRACEMMEKSADQESGDLSTPAFVVASLRHAECKMKSGRGTGVAFGEIAKRTEDSNGLKLIESIRRLRTDERSKGLADLREIAANSAGDDDLFVTEANVRLVEELAKLPKQNREATKELSALRERWYKSKKARRYADWGRALFEALAKREEWSKAAEVGVLLGAEYESDRTLQSRIAVAAWKAGQQQLATELIESLEKTRVPASLETATKAPDPEFEILERIRHSGRVPSGAKAPATGRSK